MTTDVLLMRSRVDVEIIMAEAFRGCADGGLAFVERSKGIMARLRDLRVRLLSKPEDASGIISEAGECLGQLQEVARVEFTRREPLRRALGQALVIRERVVAHRAQLPSDAAGDLSAIDEFLSDLDRFIAAERSCTELLAGAFWSGTQLSRVIRDAVGSNEGCPPA